MSEDAKAAARRAAFARRRAAFEARGPGAADKLREVLSHHRGVPLSGYMPIRTEIDPRPAMEEASALEIEFAKPTVSPETSSVLVTEARALLDNP